MFVLAAMLPRLPQRGQKALNGNADASKRPTDKLGHEDPRDPGRGRFGRCAVAPRPITRIPNVVTSLQPGRLAVSFHSAAAVIPVYVSMSNGSDKYAYVVANQIFALKWVGERVASLPPGEAAGQADSADEL